MDTKDDLRQRAQMIIGYRATEAAVNEAAEIKRLVDKLPEKFRIPRVVKNALLPQSLGRRTKGRLSSYFAVLTLLELAKKNPSLASAEEFITLADECAAAELLHRFSEKVRQSNSGSKPRADRLQTLIVSIVKRNQRQSWRDVLTALRREEHGDVIESVTEDIIEWTDAKGRAKETPIATLKDRVHRARKIAPTG